jgi:uncharacterized membrane protein YkvA (DUF1232 family)
MLVRASRLFRAIGRDVLVLWYACRNPATPRLFKAGALLLAFYVVSPIDLVPETLPLLGLVDDVTLLAFGIPAMLRLLPAHALDDARLATDRVLSRFRFPFRPRKP